MGSPLARIAVVWPAPFRVQSARLLAAGAGWRHLNASTCAVASDLFDSTSGYFSARENLEQ